MKRLCLTAFCGLFLAPGSFAIVDTNNNGVSDFWERTQNNGELFPATFDPQADSDSDGWTNAQEAAAGTDPFDPNPPDGLIRPEIAHIPAVLDGPDENGIPVLGSPETVTVTWPTLVGKQYTLLFSPDLTEGSWIPVGEPFIAYGGVCKYDFYEVSATDKCFWRVSVGDVDSDSDGLNNYEEHLTGTDPTLTDSDGDTLSDSAELIAGTDPLQADADGDGWTDPQEIAAGTDSRNQDSDGDGIPDPIDAQPLVSALAFPDADGDGIADSDDANPNDPRGPAPLIASETVSGNPVSNLVKDETARFILSVANPGGPAPTASNLTIFLNGAEDTADITAIGSTGSSTQRFLLTWTAKTTTDYPNRTLQNLTLRFRDAQMATTWLKLARIDVAQWEGMIAISPIRYSTADEEGISLLVESHINGKRHEDDFGGPWNGSALFYRGPIAIPVINNNSHNTVATFQIPMGIKFPLFITRITGSSVSNVSTIEAGDNAAFPHNAALFYNNLTSKIRYDWGGVVTEVSTSSSKVQDYGTTWSETPISIHWLRQGQWQPVAETVWSHASPFTAYVDRAVFSAYHETPTRPRVTGFSVFSKLPASITPHLAGTVDVPGLPLHPLAIKKEGTLFPVPAEIFHQITYRVDPAVEQLTNGVKLRLGRSDENGVPLAPQPGIHLYQDAQGQPLPLDANGDILLSPTANSTLFQSLISQQGLNLLLKRTTAADDSHELQIRFVSKYESGLETTAESVKILPCDIVPDWNRDAKIDSADYGKATGEHPWRFWINDDDDSGETGGTDISVDYDGGSTEPDYWGNSVDGIRDLIDFFPLHLDLKAALAIMPETEFLYFLKHESQTSTLGGAVSAPSFSVLWYPEAVLDADPVGGTGAGSYFKNLEKAADIASRSTHSIPKSGLRIPNEMLLAAKNGKGVVLVEARFATNNPIQIEIRKNDGCVLGKIDFPVKTSLVKHMLRYKFAMPGAADLGAGDIPGDPPNWPDADRNGKHFVFAHGYNVNDTQSKGWAAEAFKRMFWSGSNARFSAFAWYGYQSQIGPLTPDYQVNLENAFGTAKSFKQFLDLLEGEKTVAGHSMGNILVGSAMHDWGARPANYLMLDSAAAKECYDALEADDADQDARMVHPAWKDYPKQVRASEWHRLIPPAAWPSSDWRGKLTWKGRLANVIDNGGQTQVYNFYSSGEEVLNNPETNNPELDSSNPFGSGDMVWVTANKIWAMQEKRKGLGLSGIIHTSNYGGWLPNLLPYDQELHTTYQNEWGTVHRMRSPSELSDPLTTAFKLHLSTKPFFDDSSHESLFTPETGSSSAGSSYAYSHRNTIISEMIPCTTFAAGRNALSLLELDGLITNINMNDTMKTDPTQWPLSNSNGNDKAPNDIASRPWLHSDIREKAFTHNWKAYEKFVIIGNLK